MSKSDADRVKEFTEETYGLCPVRPIPMSKSQVLFIIRMILGELDELACTVTSDDQERDALIQEACNTRDRCTTYIYQDTDELIGAQFDALVDSWYYSLNCASKHGVNLSRIFDLVHQANMAKRDPDTGKFLRRNDGKIIKPNGWQPPDITAEIRRQRNPAGVSSPAIYIPTIFPSQ